MKYGFQTATAVLAIAMDVHCLAINCSSEIAGEKLYNSPALRTVPRHKSLRLLPVIAHVSLKGQGFVFFLQHLDFLLL